MRTGLEIQPHLDAARSREIGKALSNPLLQFRTELRADVVFFIFRHHSRESFEIVACSGEAPAPFLVGESVLVDGSLSSRIPQSIPQLRIRSAFLSTSCEMTAALSIPWRHADGTVWLLVGNAHRSGVVRTRVCTPSHLSLADSVKRAHALGTGKATRHLRSLFDTSVERLRDAERTFDTRHLLEQVAETARWLFNTSSAYVALPSTEPEKYTFVATKRVRTAQFRRLSLGIDEGMSGLVRREKQTARTVNYAEDPRLKHGPMRETLQEGFKSAVCTPLWRDGEVGGLLYVAERNFRPFTDIDVELLEEFAVLSAEAINSDEARISREECIRRAERERISEQLHDQVISCILQMGLLAGKATNASDCFARQALENIEQRAQACLDAVRTCIEANAGLGASRPMPLRHIALELKSAANAGNIRCETKVDPSADRPLPLDGKVSDALRTIGHEALKNAELHSGGSVVHVHFKCVHGRISLSIEDNGKGIPMDRIPELLDRPGHLGLRRIRAVATRLGGECSFSQSEQGGFRVVASLPTRLSH
jgi:signal transduction histidine kinase